jgi:hypothetical protein
MFTAERSKGVMKPARTAMNRATFLMEGSAALSLHVSSCAVLSLFLILFFGPGDEKER